MAGLHRVHVSGHLAAPFHALHGLHGLHAPLGFATILAGGIAIAGAIALLVPFAEPFGSASSLSVAQITGMVRPYINEWRPEADPLLTLESGVQVKSSNLKGIEIGGDRYYYRLRNTMSFDPLSRGEAGDYQSIAVLDEGTQWESEVYRLK